ncbi:hypothetical protein DL771_008813 [Monosporascus sp. 5C6A]|nr:hypothetical protein DL771_008813 [Monosporascus sp. 5C6A]
MLVFFRFMLGVSTISLGGGYVADMMEPQRRQRAIDVWTVGPVLGAIVLLDCFLFLPETYPPRLLHLKAARFRKATGHQIYQNAGALANYSDRLSLLSVAYSYMYLMVATFNDVFAETYGFNAGQTGLCYLGLGIGCLFGQYTLDLFMKRGGPTFPGANLRTPRGKLQPEDQLRPLAVAGCLLSAGLFWYGWSMEYRVHWIVPLLRTSVCGIAITFFFLAVQTYLVEAYTIYAASALAADTAVRCVFGVTVPSSRPAPLQQTRSGMGK